MEANEARGVLEGLSAKLAELDLTDNEARALSTIVQRACDADAEVGGFGLLTDDGTVVLFKDEGAPHQGFSHELQAPRLAQGLGIDPPKVWTDMRPLS